MNLQNQLKKAYEFAKLGNFNEAKLTLEKVLKKFPNHFDALVNFKKSDGTININSPLLSSKL